MANTSCSDDDSQRLLARFIDARQRGVAEDFDAWLDGQPEVAAEPDLAARVRQRHADWCEAMRCLGIPPSASGSPLSGHLGQPVSDAPHDERTEDNPIRRGLEFGDFRLIRWIARGGMGEVWEAEQKSLKRRVALKLVLPQRIDATSLSLFAREARAGGRLHHPHIVETYAFGTDEGRTWLAQELVPGSRTLKDFVDERRAAEEQEEESPSVHRTVAQLVAKIAEALQAAHEAGVIHRDVKPQNVLISPNGEPKLTDFGLARITDESALSQTGDFAGTYFYMSPEQVTAGRMGIDHKSDVFSLGVVLYELLTLHRPFEGDTTHQICEKIVTWNPPDPRKVRSQCPAELSVICSKAMEKSPSDRYRTMADFAADLHRHLANEPIIARPPGRGARAVKWAKRHPAATLALTIIVLAMAAISLLGLMAARNAEVADERANQLDQANNQLAAQTALAKGHAYSAFLHAGQAALKAGFVGEAQSLLAQCPRSLRGWEWRHLGLSLDQSLMSLEGHGDKVWSVTWSPDGRRIASGSWDGTVRIWDATSGDSLQVIAGDGHYVSSVCWSPDGTRIASGMWDKTLRVWDAASGVQRQHLLGHTDDVLAVAWSPDGSRLVSGSRDSTLRIWDAGTGDCLETLKGHARAVTSASWSPDGSRIASGSWDGTVRVWDAASGDVLRTLLGHTADVFAVAWCPDNRRIVSASQDHTLRIWDASNGFLVRTVRANDSLPLSVAWSPDGRHIASGMWDATLRVWDAATGAQLQRLLGHSDPVESVEWSPDGTRLVSGSRDTTVRIWNAASAASLQTMQTTTRGGGNYAARAVAWSPDGMQVASTSDDGAVRIWDGASGNWVKTLEGLRSYANSVVWSPDGTKIVSGSGDDFFIIWDASSGQRLQTLEGHEGAAAVDWSPDGRRIVSGSHDHTLTIWNADSGRSERTLLGHHDLVSSVSWNPDGTRIVSGSIDKTLLVWDAASGDNSVILAGHEGAVRSAAWSPNGKRVASGSDDGTLRIWDVASGECLRVVQTNARRVSSVAWSSDGSRIASGSADGTLRIWDATSGEDLQTMQSHQGPIMSVAWNPDGSRIVTASQEGTLRFWESRLGDALLLRGAEERRRRVLTLVNSLFTRHILLQPVQDALRADRSIPEEQRAVALRVAASRGDPSAGDLNARAWTLVDPHREDMDTDVGLGLRLARAATGRAPDDASYRKTLAWALFANRLYDEALSESQNALVLSRMRLHPGLFSVYERPEQTYGRFVEELHKRVDEARANSAAGDPETTNHP